MANYFQALGGCNCGLGTPPKPHASSIVALIPRSDQDAVANAIRLFQAAKRGDGLAGFGDAQQVQSAASMAATGAKVGSIIPVVGTVIGAVVGAVAGWLGAKKPPVRPSKAAVEQARALLSEYAQMAALMPNAPIPLELQQWRDINLALNIIHGGIMGLKDPRYMGIGIDPVYIPVMKSIVRKIYETQVGATVNLSEISFKDPKGRTIWYKAHAFTNPPFTDLQTFSDGPFTDAEIKHCQDTAAKKAGCVQYNQLPEVRRWHWDSLAWAARTVLPNISEADLREASKVAQHTGTSARDVVAAVEHILQANVARGQVAHLLNPSANAPPPPGPPTAQSSFPGASTSTPAPSSSPLLPAPAQVLPAPVPSSNAPPVDIHAAIAYELQRQRAAEPRAAPKVEPVKAGAGGELPLWLAGAALVFALAVPQRGRGRR